MSLPRQNEQKIEISSTTGKILKSTKMEKIALKKQMAPLIRSLIQWGTDEGITYKEASFIHNLTNLENRLFEKKTAATLDDIKKIINTLELVGISLRTSDISSIDRRAQYIQCFGNPDMRGDISAVQNCLNKTNENLDAARDLLMGAKLNKISEKPQKQLESKRGVIRQGESHVTPWSELGESFVTLIDLSSHRWSHWKISKENNKLEPLTAAEARLAADESDDRNKNMKGMSRGR